MAPSCAKRGRQCSQGDFGRFKALAHSPRQFPPGTGGDLDEVVLLAREAHVVVAGGMRTLSATWLGIGGAGGVKCCSPTQDCPGLEKLPALVHTEDCRAALHGIAFLRQAHMRTSRTGYLKWAGIGAALLWQAALVVGFFALAVWLWPAGLLGTPLSEIKLEYVLRAVVSILFLSIGATSLYLGVVDPFVKSYSELHSRSHN